MNATERTNWANQIKRNMMASIMVTANSLRNRAKASTNSDQAEAMITKVVNLLESKDESFWIDRRPNQVGNPCDAMKIWKEVAREALT